MVAISAKLTFYIAHATSLKDKRRVCRSLIDKARQRFNASVAEVDTQDIHQTLTVGVAVVSGGTAHAQRSLDEIMRSCGFCHGVSHERRREDHEV